MSFLANVQGELHPFEFAQDDRICFECGRKLKISAVRYDGYVEEEQIKSLLLHPACAVVVGNRLIADGYLHRQES